MLLKITLPYPPRQLNPNYTAGWQAKMNIKKKYKEDCRLLAFGKSLRHKGKISMNIIFYPPTAANRDLDNALASAKSGIDGLCMALGIDDKQLRPITIDWGEVVRNGKLEITLETIQ